MQFATRILAFVESINLANSDRKTLLHTLVRYTLQIDGSQRATVLRKAAFGMDRVPEVMHFKTQYLDVSSYIHRKLWKGVIAFLKTGVVEEEIKGDVDYCLQLLRPEDKSFLQDSSLNEESSVENFDLEGWAKDINILQWVRRKIYKLKFITDYDPGIDLEDFSQDLACEVIRVINTYQRVKTSEKHSQKPLKERLIKYVDGALANKMGSLIEHHTSLSRRRSVSTNDDLYKQLKAAKKKVNLAKRAGGAAVTEATKVREILKEIQTTESDYFAQTSSIEPDQEIGTASLDQNAWVDFTDTEEKLNEALWAEKVQACVVDPRDLDYINLVLEEPKTDKWFQTWVDSEGKNINTLNTRLRLAQKFIVEKDKGGHYRGLPSWNKDNLVENENLLRMFA